MLKRFFMLSSLCVMAASAWAAPIYKFTDANGVVTYTDKVTKGAKVLVFEDDTNERLDRQVRLNTRTVGGDTVFEARNDLLTPVQVELRLDQLQNVAGINESASVRRLLPPNSVTTLMRLKKASPDRPLRYKQVFNYAMGDPSRGARDYAYPLPWLGGPFRISQGANGAFSHNTPKGRYAVDIAMPEGTPIIASRPGTVVKVENSQQAGRSSNPSGNFVRVLHDDGTMSVYLHLMQGSVKVREGQRVVTGTPLALSGNTGRSTGPHLHFVIQRNTGLALESIPFRFAQPVDNLPNFAIGGR
ncbi:peptidoglycan DD-metalloendopeptidase family protein [Pseudomonas duriflava]|nr:M23 family metallopeptidase [Pseudomonas duriflava]